MILLTSDTHLDDNPANEYRWAFFAELHKIIQQYAGTPTQIEAVFHLGDFVDRKDRHSAAFVNRVIGELQNLVEWVPVYIMRGNHDTPLRGPAYWEFLSSTVEGLQYIIKPTPVGDLLLLPFSPDPMEEWKGLKFSQYKALFLHATVTGAMSENGHELTGGPMPLLPRSCKVYSGDIHTPQQVKNLTYVGAPHPTKFGDDYPCRMLVLDDKYDIYQEVLLTPPQKHMIEVNSLEDLVMHEIAEGDQLRIRFNLAFDEFDNWGATQTRIAEWAAQYGVEIASLEVVVDTPRVVGEADLESSPETILRNFALEESIPEDLLNLGLSLVEAAKA